MSAPAAEERAERLVPVAAASPFAWACLTVWSERTGEDKLWMRDGRAYVNVPVTVMEDARGLLRRTGRRAG